MTRFIVFNIFSSSKQIHARGIWLFYTEFYYVSPTNIDLNPQLVSNYLTFDFLQLRNLPYFLNP